MQKKILAAVVGSMIAGQAMAVTVVDDGTNKVTIGGHVGMRYQYNKGTDNYTKGDSSRINFGFESKLTESTTAFAKAEWGFDTTSSGNHQKADGKSSSFFWQRLGYVGVKNDQLGSVSFGKQWSSYAKVAMWTDKFATTGGDASGMYSADGEVLGTSRADDALQYNGSFSGLNISAQIQLGKRTLAQASGATLKRDSSYGLSVSYDLPVGLSIGAAYNQAKAALVVGNVDEKAKSMVLAAKFEADSIYASASYASLKNRTLPSYVFGGNTYDKAKGIELYASYRLNDNFKLETGYNNLKDKSNNASKAELKYFPVGVVYTTGPVQLSGTYVVEKSKKADGSKVKDRAVLQARYYF